MVDSRKMFMIGKARLKMHENPANRTLVSKVAPPGISYNAAEIRLPGGEEGAIP